MEVSNIISLLGGVAMFLFGMSVMGDSLKKVAGSKITQITIDAFINNDIELAMKIDPLEEVIDDLCDIIKADHIDRVSRQECTIETGFEIGRPYQQRMPRDNSGAFIVR